MAQEKIESSPDAAGPDQSTGAGQSNVPLAVIGLALGILVSVLDQTVVSIALPNIAADLGGIDQISWVVTAYVLASTATGTLYGRLSDRFSRRGTFLFAMLIFTVASVLCAVADSMGQLIAYRALQGIGAGALFAVPTIALSELVKPESRGRMQGAIGALFAIASLAGPLVGGALTDAAGWRWIFYINLPLGALSMLLVAFALRLPQRTSRPSIDFLGSALLVGGVVALLLTTEWGGRTYAWISGTILGLAAATVLLFALFVFWERRATSPVVPMRLFSNPTVRVVLPATAVLGALLYGSIVFLPTYLQSAFDISATLAGLGINPYMLTFVVASFLSGNRVSATGNARPFLIAGPIAIAAGFGLLSLLDADSSYGMVVLALLVLGVGVGFIMQLLVTVAQNAVGPADLGATSAAILSIRGLGMSLGVAIFGNLLSRELGPGTQAGPAVANAIPDIMVWGIPLALLLLLLTALMPARTIGRQTADADAEQPDRVNADAATPG